MTNIPHILFLVDVSGSMSGHVNNVGRHLQEIQQALKNTGREFTMGVATFSDSYYPATWGSARLNHNGGGTNLYGSTIRLLQDLSSQFSAATPMMICVITDGEDSEGGRYGWPDAVAAEVTMAEEVLGWDFLFVGTNQDAVKVGAQMGVKTSKALSFANTTNGFDAMLQSLADITVRWLNGAVGHNDDFFSDETRDIQTKLGAVKF